MAKRLRDVCKLREDENLWLRGKGFIVRDLPWTEATPRDSALRVRELGSHRAGRNSQQGASRRHGHRRTHLPRPRHPDKAPLGKEPANLPFMDDWYPIQVKQKDKAGRPDIDNFEAVMMRTDRPQGVLCVVRFHQRCLARKSAGFSSKAASRLFPSQYGKSWTT